MYSSTVQCPTLPCNLEQYGNTFPLQSPNKGQFQVTSNKQHQVTRLFESAVVSKSVMNFSCSDHPIKLGHDAPALVDLWQRKKTKLTAKQFNGKQLCVYYTLNKHDDNKLKLVASDFISVSISRAKKSQLEKFTLRDFYNCGVLIHFITTDNKYVYTEKPNEKLAFPGGFIFGEKDQLQNKDIDPVLKQIQSKEMSFSSLVIETAIKEVQQEIIALNISPDSCDILCEIGEDFIFPSKRTDNHLKQVHCIKSVGVSIRSSLSSVELIAQRQKSPPVDAEELPLIKFLNLNDKFNFELADNFIVEHKDFYQFLQGGSEL